MFPLKCVAPRFACFASKNYVDSSHEVNATAVADVGTVGTQHPRQVLRETVAKSAASSCITASNYGMTK